MIYYLFVTGRQYNTTVGVAGADNDNDFADDDNNDGNDDNDDLATTEFTRDP